ncbi:hypothetical protein J4N45_11115 [Vibrio sp. SCSIO 43140]|uniref:hypothetical protein n=1 Tax=Vibrio sp. SCSIO 43140 TaxID=2819100 RepID=UPI002075FE38|nr:hypothetical protein [Vibrio sp. SCSIO 43140]USD59081.1 hypothetical protein J4N45_11115 [Vibrio sp. SCSIO 43140]
MIYISIKVWLWKRFRCRKGWHWDDEGTANFCAACGKLLKPEAYSDYLVTLLDGTEKTVRAINHKHASSLVIYGDDLSFNGRTGQPIGEQIVHPDNVKSVIKV